MAKMELTTRTTLQINKIRTIFPQLLRKKCLAMVLIRMEIHRNRVIRKVVKKEVPHKMNKELQERGNQRAQDNKNQAKKGMTIMVH